MISGKGVGSMAKTIRPIARIPDASGSSNDIAIRAILQKYAEEVAAGVLEGSGLPSEATKPLAQKIAETAAHGLSDFASLALPTGKKAGDSPNVDGGGNIPSGSAAGVDMSDVFLHGNISRDPPSEIHFNADGTPTTIKSRYFGKTDPMYQKLMMLNLIGQSTKTIKSKPIKRENLDKRENQVSNVQQGIAEFDREVNLFNVKF